MVKEQQTNIFQAVKLDEGQYEQIVVQRHSGAGFQGSWGHLNQGLGNAKGEDFT